MPSFSSDQINDLKRLWDSKNKAKESNKTSVSTDFKFHSKNVIKNEANKHTPSRGSKRKRNVSTSDIEDLSSSIAEESRKRLSMTQFRHMNQFLYTNPSKSAVDYMDGDKFTEYHDAYSQIASSWPVKPIDMIIDKISKLKMKRPIIADIGCGSVPLIADKLKKATVHSYDLVSLDDRVEVADATNIPLEDASVDIVVYSLSLMATDVNAQIAEGTRILKVGGMMFIAEVTSRFDLNKDDESNCKDSKVDQEKSSEGSDAGIRLFLKQINKYCSLQKVNLQQLPPNNFFTLISLRKKSDSERLLPTIHLKPCIYKPR